MEEREEVLKELYDSVLEGDADRAIAAAERGLRAGLEPLRAIDLGLTPAIREVGDRFGRMDMFLPEMVMSAQAMASAVEVLQSGMAAGALSKKAKLVVGTVKGDVHDIGKNIAIALLRVNGFEVIDLGRDVPAATFVDVAMREGAQVIGMSGLLTTSLPLMGDVIKILEEDGLRDKFKVIIGGGPTSQDFAARIQADGYAETAHDGVMLCQSLLGVVA